MYIASLPLYQEGNYVGDEELQLSRRPRKTRYDQVTHKQASINASFAQDRFFFTLKTEHFSVFFF